MNLQTYIQGALTTESRIDNVTTDVQQLTSILRVIIAAGNLLDVVKKDTFYGLPTTEEKSLARASRIIENRNHLGIATDQYFANDPQPATTLSHVNPRVAHAIIGLATEAVELLEALLTSIESGAPVDAVNLLEELGDLNWYHAIAVDALEGDWELILETNLKKLEQRNKGKKFNAEATINRDVEQERELLETNLGSSST